MSSCDTRVKLSLNCIEWKEEILVKLTQFRVSAHKCVALKKCVIAELTSTYFLMTVILFKLSL